MMYWVDIDDKGYIIGVASIDSEEIVGSIDEAEYIAILSKIHSKPVPPAGYDYWLKDTLEWELVEVPPEPVIYTQESLSSMTNDELEQILHSFGITANMNKANMIRLILAVQGGDTVG